MALPCAGAARGETGAPTPAQVRLQQWMRSRVGSGGSNGGSVDVSPERLASRKLALADGEAALARLRTGDAMAHFERAAGILHAADTEMGIVRCHMQAGDYRRALAFGAHTAGAHLDVVGGTALYAWLLHCGGQEAVAWELLAQAEARAPTQPLLAAVRAQLRAPWPKAAPPLLDPPTRLAPYASMAPAAAGIGSATLLPGGALAAIPASAVSRSARFWVRNGLGDTVAASPATHLRFADGVAVLRLHAPLPAAGLRLAPRDPFPGSVALAASHALQARGLPAWPLLRPGFLGQAADLPGVRSLGVVMLDAGRLGGPVFDGFGRMAGIALGRPAGPVLVGAGRLRALVREGQLPEDRDAARSLGVDAVYELALRACLQLLRA